jgi:hypothetical protein
MTVAVEKAHFMVVNISEKGSNDGVISVNMHDDEYL